MLVPMVGHGALQSASQIPHQNSQGEAHRRPVKARGKLEKAAIPRFLAVKFNQGRRKFTRANQPLPCGLTDFSQPEEGRSVWPQRKSLLETKGGQPPTSWPKSVTCTTSPPPPPLADGLSGPGPERALQRPPSMPGWHRQDRQWRFSQTPGRSRVDLSPSGQEDDIPAKPGAAHHRSRAGDCLEGTGSPMWALSPTAGQGHIESEGVHGHRP